MAMKFMGKALLQALAAACACAVLILIPGCSVGFTNLHPGENSALYQHLFDDIISNYDEPNWLWVRGVISGDLNGNGVIDEEIVLATIQKGTPRAPGPIDIAFLVACSVDKEGKRTALARQLLFDRDPVARAPRPINDLGIVKAAPFTRCRAQMVSDKVSLAETVVVYFWNDPLPTSVWYVGFAYEDGQLVKNLETLMWQNTPGFLSVNLDRTIEASNQGYQLVFGVAALPDDIWKKLGPASEAPLWGHVFARNSLGYYNQADQRFAANYRKIEAPWNQAYLKAALNALPPEELAWFEYHMGILNFYTENFDMSRAFLLKARRFAKDPLLKRAIDEGFVYTRFSTDGNEEKTRGEDGKQDSQKKDIAKPVTEKPPVSGPIPPPLSPRNPGENPSDSGPYPEESGK